MKSIKKSVGATLGVAVVLLGTVVAASPATAAPEARTPAAAARTTEMGPTIVDECPSARFCFYINQNFYIPSSGNPYGYRIAYASAGRAGFSSQPAAGGGTFANNVESVDNNTGLRICLYNGSSNFIASVNPGAERATLSAANNLAVGWRAVTTASCPPNYIDD